MSAKKMDPIDIAAQQRAREQAEVEQAFLKGMTTLRDLSPIIRRSPANISVI